MIVLKSSDHVRSMRQIKGFRSVTGSTAAPTRPLDQGRILFERARLAIRQARRRWIILQCGLPRPYASIRTQGGQGIRATGRPTMRTGKFNQP